MTKRWDPDTITQVFGEDALARLENYADRRHRKRLLEVDAEDLQLAHDYIMTGVETPANLRAVQRLARKMWTESTPHRKSALRYIEGLQAVVDTLVQQDGPKPEAPAPTPIIPLGPTPWVCDGDYDVGRHAEALYFRRPQGKGAHLRHVHNVIGDTSTARARRRERHERVI